MFLHSEWVHGTVDGVWQWTHSCGDIAAECSFHRHQSTQLCKSVFEVSSSIVWYFVWNVLQFSMHWYFVDWPHAALESSWPGPQRYLRFVTKSHWRWRQRTITGEGAILYCLFATFWCVCCSFLPKSNVHFALFQSSFVGRIYSAHLCSAARSRWDCQRVARICSFSIWWNKSSKLAWFVWHYCCLFELCCWFIFHFAKYVEPGGVPVLSFLVKNIFFFEFF